VQLAQVQSQLLVLVQSELALVQLLLVQLLLAQSKISSRQYRLAVLPS